MRSISVIMPVFNVGEYVSEAIHSVIGQSYTDWECICVDDGSTDNSVQIVRQMVSGDSRFRVVEQQNAGPGIARNTGLGLASGDYVTFLDSDDLLHPEALARLVNLAQTYESDFVVCSLQQMPESGPPGDVCGGATPEITVYRAPLLPLLEDGKQLQVHTCGKLYLRSLHGHLRFPGGLGSEDTHFFLDAIVNAKTLVTTSEPLYLYREREHALTRGPMRHRNYIAGSEKVALHCEELCRAGGISVALAAKLQMIYGTNRIFIELADMAGNPQLGDAQRRELMDMACAAISRVTRAVAGRHRVVAFQHLLTYLAAVRLHSLWWLKRVSGLRRILIGVTRAGTAGRCT